MGNCLDSESAHDDISLLRESNNQTRDNSSDQLGPHSFHVKFFNFQSYSISNNLFVSFYKFRKMYKIYQSTIHRRTSLEPRYN